MIRRWVDGDMVTSGKHFATGASETVQAVAYRLRLFLGEYFLDVSQGTPWFQEILGKAPQGVAEIAIKQQILSVDRVAGIQSFEFSTDRNQRRVSIRAELLDIDSNAASISIDEVI